MAAHVLFCSLAYQTKMSIYQFKLIVFKTHFPFDLYVSVSERGGASMVEPPSPIFSFNPATIYISSFFSLLSSNIFWGVLWQWREQFKTMHPFSVRAFYLKNLKLGVLLLPSSKKYFRSLEKNEYCDVAPCGCIFIIAGEGMVVVHPSKKFGRHQIMPQIRTLFFSEMML